MLRSAIVEIIPVNARNDHMIEFELGHRFGHTGRFVGIKGARLARLDIAKGASPGTGVAHDHHGGVFLGPALADIRTGRLFAHSMKIVVAHDRSRLIIDGRARRLHANPFGLALNRVVRPIALFRVAEVLDFFQVPAHQIYQESSPWGFIKAEIRGDV